MMREFDREPYQHNILATEHHRAIVEGGRQVGKTEVAARDALIRCSSGQMVVTVHPLHRIAMEFMKRLREIAESRNLMYESDQASLEHAGGRIRAISTAQFEEMEPFDMQVMRAVDRPVNAFIVDEAQEIPEEYLFEIDRYETDPDVLLTTTPRPVRSLVDVWAESDPRWFTAWVPTDSVSFTNDEHIEQFRKDWSEVQQRYELDAAFRSDERRDFCRTLQERAHENEEEPERRVRR